MKKTKHFKRYLAEPIYYPEIYDINIQDIPYIAGRVAFYYEHICLRSDFNVMGEHFFPGDEAYRLADNYLTNIEFMNEVNGNAEYQNSLHDAFTKIINAESHFSDRIRSVYGWYNRLSESNVSPHATYIQVVFAKQELEYYMNNGFKLPSAMFSYPEAKRLHSELAKAGVISIYVNPVQFCNFLNLESDVELTTNYGGFFCSILHNLKDRCPEGMASIWFAEACKRSGVSKKTAENTITKVNKYPDNLEEVFPLLDIKLVRRIRKISLNIAKYSAIFR